MPYRRQRVRPPFYEAGQWSKALDYARRGRERAQTLNAPWAAVEQFSRALTAAQHLTAPPDLTALYRLRAVGLRNRWRIEHAVMILRRHSIQHRLPLTGRGNGRFASLWLNCGQRTIMAGRGDYFQRALTLARTLALHEAGTQNHAVPLAHTLNRLGNWYLNVGQPPEALRCHQASIDHFPGPETMRRILAQTYDLLGLMIYLGGNPVQGAIYLQQAIELFQTLQARQSLALQPHHPRHLWPGHSTDSVVPASMRVTE